MTPQTAETFAHRALAAAHVMGVVARAKRGTRIVAGELEAVAGACFEAADLVVMTDEGTVGEADLSATWTAVSRAAPEGVVALVVASPVTHALARLAGRGGGRDQPGVETGARDDAWGSAQRWATSRHDALAPAVEPARLARIVEAAAACGLVLVEPETAIAVPTFSRVRPMRSARARALFATVALGASARPLLFVPLARAPRAGLARARVERIADGWVDTSPADPQVSELEATDATTDLAGAAHLVLGEATRAGRGALPFPDLLRAARERWTVLARARGERVTPSSRDARDLTTWLFARAASEQVRLYALDPAEPGWELVIAAGTR